jgi:hypothetical protein
MKVQSKLVGNTPTQEIDWDKPQLLVYEIQYDSWWVIQTNGKHQEEKFEGMVVWANSESSIRVGSYQKTWNKDKYKLLHPNQQVILQNTDEPSPTSE